MKLKDFEISLEELSSSQQLNLLWPTMVPKPLSRDVARFFGPSNTEFTFLGRPLVARVLESLDERRIFLYGPQGVGKSHILAAVALLLSVKFGKGDHDSHPVCYIPDMRGLWETRRTCLCVWFNATLANLRFWGDLQKLPLTSLRW